MLRNGSLTTLAGIAALLGCSDATGPAAPPAAAVAALLAQPAPPQIGGEWHETRTNFIHLTPFAAELWGFVAEGARTTIRCSAEGTMSLIQDGSSFSGSLTEEFVCISQGGQQREFGPETTDIVDGKIGGQAIAFTLIGQPGPVNCPANGVISAEDGVAVAMRGTWRCIEPGHPRSVWNTASPPRLGPNRAQWQATR
jgi:hypothetical protein